MDLPTLTALLLLLPLLLLLLLPLLLLAAAASPSRGAATRCGTAARISALHASDSSSDGASNAASNASLHRGDRMRCNASTVSLVNAAVADDDDDDDDEGGADEGADEAMSISSL